MYLATNEFKYLASAEKTAKWIIKTAQPNGLVNIGYDATDQKWISSVNIVDIGFTAGFFARLYEITHDHEYLSFMKNFIDAYIQSFFNPEKQFFATSIDKYGTQKGGFFGRGQAWLWKGSFLRTKF